LKMLSFLRSEKKPTCKETNKTELILLNGKDVVELLWCLTAICLGYLWSL
jgi:hypothetical protein